MQDNSDTKEDVMRRLKKIEGQVKGIQRMIENDKYCADVLVQVAAVRAAINRVGTIMLENHTKVCLKSSFENGHGDETLSELIDLIGKFMR